MMAYEIEEKQYEIAANLELVDGTRRLYSPGQVLEHLLGFDVAATPDAQNVIWGILGQGIPSGIQLMPNLWPPTARPPANQIPSYVVSLIFQYKRSEYVPATARQAKQYAHWQHAYYRYKLDRAQHTTLLQIEPVLATLAVVRYAAPVFHQYSELEQFQLQRTVLEHSNFVAPLALGPTHTTWSFDQAGLAGWANPDGEELRSETLREVLEHADSIAASESLEEHLKDMASAIGRLRLSPAVEIPEALTIRNERVDDRNTIEAIMNLAQVARVMSFVGASWWIEVRDRTSE